mgnify:CR=1 FL=1|jgi:hypothetical protein
MLCGPKRLLQPKDIQIFRTQTSTMMSTELQLFERLLAETFRLLLMLYVSLEVAAKVRCSPLVAVWGLCSI